LTRIEHKEVAELYLHINNGGVVFKVLQAEYTFGGGAQAKAPVLEVGAGYFSQETNRMRLLLRPEALKALGEMLVRASELVAVVEDPIALEFVENPRHVKYGDSITDLGLVAPGDTSTG
jgi:hypothetical protein